jgi:hypothetical protein
MLILRLLSPIINKTNNCMKIYLSVLYYVNNKLLYEYKFV